MIDPKEDLRERLAAVQHDIWRHWMRYQFAQCRRPEGPDDGTLIIPADKVKRWLRQTETPYADLTEREKESDRHQADKVLVVIGPAGGISEVERKARRGYEIYEENAKNCNCAAMSFDDWLNLLAGEVRL